MARLYVDNANALAASVTSLSEEYAIAEFPTEFWRLGAVVTNVTDSIEQYFVEMLPDDHRIERVYWAWGEDALRVWIVIPEPDFALQEPIYDAQLAFMDKFHEYLFDFHVIYRFSRPHDAVKPQGSRRVK